MSFLGALRAEAAGIWSKLGSYARADMHQIAGRSEEATLIFQKMVNQQQAKSTLAEGRILGFHRTSPENAIDLLNSQAFIGRRGGLHMGSNPDANPSFGPSILIVTKRNPAADIPQEVFSKDNIKIFPTNYKDVEFSPFKYDPKAENAMRFQKGYEDYEANFYGD